MVLTLLHQIAILNEVSGKGPYCSLVMSVVIAKDLITFVTFAINLELVGMVWLPIGQKLACQ